MDAHYELIIFDCDGVLVDSEPIFNLVWAEVLSDSEFNISSQDLVDRFCGMSVAEMFRIIEHERGRPLPADFERRVSTLVDARCEESLTTTSGVHEALTSIRVPVCVASSSTPDRIRTSLRIVGLLDRFAPHLFSATAVQRGKPAPDLFLHAARSMRAPPARCLVVEDSVPGVQVGVAAGMTVIGYCGGGHCRANHADLLRQHGASAIVADMRSLVSIIDASGEF